MSKFNKLEFIYSLIILLTLCKSQTATAECQSNCNLALASYYVPQGATLPQISNYFFDNDPNLIDDIADYNPHQVKNNEVLSPNIRINIPFECGCVNDSFLGHVFQYYQFQKQDTYPKIARNNYTNLTTDDFVAKFNSFDRHNVPDGAFINVPVNCSCGNSRVSKDYGLFITYPLRRGESLRSISREFNLSESLLQSYNPGVNFSAGIGLVYIPGKDKNGIYPPYISPSASSGLSGGAIAGVCVAVVAVIVVLATVYFKCRSKETKETSPPSEKSEHKLTHSSTAEQDSSGTYMGNSVEFSFEQLANATNNFNINNKIGSGGFGDVYIGELLGKKAAIKRMGMQASREFLAELKVLTRVHHLNLVRLLGYCVEGSLFLVYEYIENGNLSQHLRNSEKDPLPWSTRVQIALDSAKGLEYIHEHTDPVYIHRDIKPENILITNDFRAKVADFGLAKLAEVGTGTLPSRLIGTFGYMPPEYAHIGEVTRKVDVFAFGVVLYELVSAKGAIVWHSELVSETRGLVALFEDVLSLPDPNEICKLIDSRLGEDYPLDSVRKVVELARACTQDNPLHRPSMRSVVVALMSLSSTTEVWDISTLNANNELINQVSAR